MVFGAAISLSHRIRKRSIEIDEDGKVKDSEDSFESLLSEVIASTPLKTQLSSKIISLSIIGFAVFVTLFGFTGVTFAQGVENQQSNGPSQSKLLLDGAGNGSVLQGAKTSSGQIIPMTINPKVEDVAKELRCPTCIGMSVLESGTLQSVAMRTEIEKQLSEGKSKKEIIQYFKKAYGPWILREPDVHSSVGFIVWIIPILGFILGPIFIIFGLKQSKRKKINENKYLLCEIEKYIAEKKKGIEA